MEFRREICGSVYVFDCFVWETCYSWGHDCTLYKDGEQVAHSCAIYYNRTWETYQFHTVIDNCIYQLKETRIAELKQEFLAENGLKRMSPKAKVRFEQLCCTDIEMLALAKLKDAMA